MSITEDIQTEVLLHDSANLAENLPRLSAFVKSSGEKALSRDPAWLTVLEQGLGHQPFALEAVRGGRTVGVLPLAFVHSWCFGRFLVGLPYLNSGGVVAEDLIASAALIGRALALSETLNVRHLELRHEQPVDHPAFNHRMTTKVHMRLPLPEAAPVLWNGFDPRVRNLVRKGQKHEPSVAWGGEELLPEFHHVLSVNMRDLGTPVFGVGFFRSILRAFPDRAELCVTSLNGRPAAVALLLHGEGVTEVPSASSLRVLNSTNVNMVMYWNLLQRAVDRGQSTFDFGRSSRDGNHYRFKKQWGAEPADAEWQYVLRTGKAGEMRPDNAKYRLMIRVWQRLPVGLTRLIGPPIVRGIP